MKKCPKCNENKVLNEFTKHGKSKDGLYYCCKECKNKSRPKNQPRKKYKDNTSKERRERILKSNPNYFSEKRLEWARNNPEKIKEKRVREQESGSNARACAKRRSILNSVLFDLTNEDWEKCLEYFEHSCAYCGKEEKLQMEHVTPISKGGNTVIWNIVPSCSECNTSKHTKNMETWYKDKTFYSIERLNKIVSWLKESRVV